MNSHWETDANISAETLAKLKAEIGEDEMVQRKLAGRCVYCDEPANAHLFNCPAMSRSRFMYGEWAHSSGVTVQSEEQFNKSVLGIWTSDTI